MSVKISLFKNLGDIPLPLMRQLRCMCWPDGSFREIMGEHYQKPSVRHYIVRDILVLHAPDGYALGWGIHFSTDIEWLRNYSGNKGSLGFWVRSTHRYQGYGKLLVKEAHRQWANENPLLFDGAKKIWNSL